VAKSRKTQGQRPNSQKTTRNWGFEGYWAESSKRGNRKHSREKTVRYFDMNLDASSKENWGKTRVMKGDLNSSTGRAIYSSTIALGWKKGCGTEKKKITVEGASLPLKKKLTLTCGSS